MIFYLIVLVIAAGEGLGSGGHDSSGPRFQSDFPHEVAFTPERGSTLDCMAHGQPTPHVTWLTSSSSKAAGASPGVWSPVVTVANLVDVQANGSLSILPFRPEHFRPDIHAATYKCQATSAIGKIVSTPIHVRAVMLPPFEASVDNPKVQRGNTGVFRCNVPEAVRDHVVITSWIQDNRYDIFLTSSQDGRHVMLPNGELHVLSVRNGDEAHFYHCRLLIRPNGHTMTSTTPGRLQLLTDSIIKTAPVIVDSASHVRSWRGQDAVLPCVFQGYPRPRVKWYRQTGQYGTLLLPVHHGGRRRLIGGTLVIKSAHPEDQGRYFCAVNNSVASAEARTDFTVREKLQLRLEPTALVVDADKEVLIACSWTGHPRPTITWLKDGQRYLGNGRVLTSADSIQLHIGSVQREDQGMYQCLAFNDEDSAQASVQLKIGAFPPQLKQMFVRQILHPGASVSFKCVASGVPAPHFTWVLDGYPLPVSERYFLGQQSGAEDEVISHLNISHVRIEDGGTYRCTAENRVGRADYSATLHVYGPPYVRPMGGVSAVGGRRLDVPCPVAGYPIETIIWEKDGRRLPSSSRHRVQFNGTLTIDPVDKSADSGVYTCEARGQNNMAARQSLNLNVIAAPRINPFHMPHVMVNARVQISCVIEEGDPPLSIRWFRNGRPLHSATAPAAPAPPPPSHLSHLSAHVSSLPPGLRVIDFNAYSSILTMDHVTLAHGGNYSCLAENAAGIAVHAALLQVSVPPTWTSQPSDVQTVSGHSVELHCQVQGVPEPQVTWYFSKDKGSDKYSALFNNNRTLIGNQSLMISPVEASDQGYYQCEASNGVGSNINADVTLQVQLPPEVHLNDDYLAVRRGSGTVLRCTVRGDLPLSIQWRKDGNPIDPSVQPRMLSQSNSASGASGGHGGGGGGGVMFSEFSIANSASSDEALYECTAANIHGEDSDTVFVQVQDVPHPPQELRIKEVASRQVTVEWKAPADGGNPLQEYIIFYKPLLNINEGTMRQERVPASQTSASVKNLQPATTYQLHLAAANSLGQGQPSATLTVTSDEEVPEGPPLNVMASSVTSRDLLVVWSPPMAVLQNGVLSGYFVSVREMGDETGKTLNRTLVSPPSGSSHGEFRLTRLRPNTNYIVYVQAVNSKGTGPPSPGLSIRTLEDVPEEAPGNVACVALNSQSLQITWQPPGAERRNGVLRGYRVFFDRADRDLTALDREAAASKTTTELTLLLSGLQKFSNYSVQVLAFTAVGDGMRSAPLTCTTEEDVPEMPAQVKVMLSSSDSIIVSWLPSQRPNGRITHYAIYSKEIERGQDTNSQKWTVADHVTRSEIRNLRRRAVYYFQVAAATRAGEGPKSPTVSFNYSPSNKIPAAIVSIGSDYTVARWSRMILPCMPVGDPPLQVAWFEEGRQIQDWLTLSGIKSHGDQWRAFIGDQDQDGESVVQVFTNGSLHVSRLAENAGGNYTCKVRNRHGEDSVSYPISVVVPPPAPILRFAASNWSSVTLQWSVSSSFQQLIGRTEKSNKMSPESKRSRVSPVRGFIFRHRPRISESGWTEFSVGPSLRSVTVQELSCGTEYEFLLVASSRIGNSSISNVVSAKTKGSPPEYLPTEESELAVTATSCTVYMSNWQDRGCPIQQFIFRFRTADSSDWIIAGAESPPQQAFLLGGLQPSTAYVIRVTATNVAGSTSREYAIETESPVDDFTWRNRGEEHSGLAPLFADPRVAVPIAISALAIFLTAITLLLRFRYRSQYIRPPSQAPDPSSHIRPYADESTDDACSLSVAKRVASMDNCSSDYGDDVSPYAVFPMPHTKASYSSTRRMKTFVVEKHDPVEMSNYAPNRGLADPNYDYIAPCGADVGDFRPRRVMVPKINPHSVFVPIPARSHPHQPQLHHQPGSGTSTFHRMSTWNNQETLALTQRL